MMYQRNFAISSVPPHPPPLVTLGCGLVFAVRSFPQVVQNSKTCGSFNFKPLYVIHSYSHTIFKYLIQSSGNHKDYCCNTVLNNDLQVFFLFLWHYLNVREIKKIGNHASLPFNSFILLMQFSELQGIYMKTFCNC